jgi:hypothetical protein
MMFACIGIARGAGLLTQLASDQRCLVKPAPTTLLTVQARYEGTRVSHLLILNLYFTKFATIQFFNRFK